MFAVAAILFGLVVSGTRRPTGTGSEERAASREPFLQEQEELAGSGKSSEAPQGPMVGIVEGIRYAWRNPLLRTMLFALALLSFSTSGPLRVGSAMLAETRLGGAETFGILLSAFGAGSLIGLLVAGSLVRTGRRRGIPLAATISAANVQASKLLAQLVDSVDLVKGPRGRPSKRPDKLHADKGYDNPRCRQFLRHRGIEVRIARRGVESGQKLGRHRWEVERSFSWLYRFRRLTVRYERRADIHQAFLDLGCALICCNYLHKGY